MEDYTNDAFLRIVDDLSNINGKRVIQLYFAELYVNVEELSIKLKRYLHNNDLPFFLSKIEPARSDSPGYAQFCELTHPSDLPPVPFVSRRLTTEYAQRIFEQPLPGRAVRPNTGTTSGL